MTPRKKRPAKKRSALTPAQSAATPATTPPPLEMVVTWLLDGLTEYNVRAAIAEQFPTEEPERLLAAAARYFALVGGLDETDEITDADVRRGFCAAAYRHIYRKSLEAADFATALRAVRALQTANT